VSRSLPYPLVEVVQVSKNFGARRVLHEVSFRIAPGDRLAVVGRNGEGKTTLLRIIAGQLAADAGRVSLPKGARLALHDQRPPLEVAGRTLEQYVAEGMADAIAAEVELADLEARMAGGDHGPQVLAAYERAHATLEHAGGYHWRAWMMRVTRGLGIPDARLADPLVVFSGGELTRASLARALVARPDILLLDEPTNHLDVQSTEWLEDAIAEMGCAVVLVSHDRYFLESIATGVLELDQGRSKLWPFGYSRFRKERALALETQAKEAERTAAEIARLERFVERWSAGTRSRQATSRRKRLARIARPEINRSAKSLAFGFPPVAASGRIVLEAHGVSVAVGERMLIRNADVVIERGERVAVVGPNGAGKTTLLETLIGLRPPSSGRIGIGHKVDLAYYSQHDQDLRGDRTIVDTILAETALTRTQARTVLGAFLFPGELADRRVADLSGGERRRLQLALLVARGSNLLVFDEPTNHLDAESREALEDALDAYAGTIVLVSHDRALIDAVATRTLAIEDGSLIARDGGWADLLQARADARAAASPPARGQDRPQSKPKKSTPQATVTRPRAADAAGASSAKGGAGRRVRQLETKINRLEAELESVNAQLLDPDVAQDHVRSGELGAQYRKLEEDISWALAEWEDAAEAAGV
jgi:ATP-binding cassette, subfamily F, member 3